MRTQFHFLLLKLFSGCLKWTFVILLTFSFYFGNISGAFGSTGSQGLSCQDVLGSSSSLSIKDLTAAYTVLKMVGDVSVLDPRIREGLRQLLPTTDENLTNPLLLKKFDEYLQLLTIAEGRPAATNHLALLKLKEQELRDFASGARQPKWPDYFDMNGGWGFSFLSTHEVVIKNDLERRLLVNASAHHNGLGFAERFGIISRLWDYVGDFRLRVRKLSQVEMEVHAFFQTGSDANNYIYEIADRVWEKRQSTFFKKVDPAARGEVLTFDGVFGGGRGRIEQLGRLRRDNKRLEPWIVESPHSSSFHPTDPVEIHRLKKLEERVLATIEKKFRDPKLKVGAFLFEPILGISGVYVYRPQFVIKLRSLCDKYQIPILADEILTGGGRTGKFFAYQHYPGFEPDFISFGKGMVVAGLLQVKRSRMIYPLQERQKDLSGVTLAVNFDSMVKSIAVLDLIEKNNWIENAQKTGEYFRERIKQEFPNAAHEIRGVGFLLRIPFSTRMVRAKDRLMPRLDFTREQADEAIEEMKRWNTYSPEKFRMDQLRDWNED